jgi:putative membrane protein
MDHLWLKALHVAAAMTWIGGMLAASLALAAEDARFLAVMHRWDKRVTTPAMLLVWLLGITMASQAGLFPERWLQLKLAVVLALSLFYGLLSGTLRRRAGEQGGTPSMLPRLAPPLIVAAALAVAILAVAKPL